MSKRKAKPVKNPFLVRGTYSPVAPSMYLVRVDKTMLAFLNKMVGDPQFREKVTKLL
jgi:hypothetical protein